MATARQVIRSLDWAFEGISAAPVLAVRMSRAGAGVIDFVEAFQALNTRGDLVPVDRGHIRRRANRNRVRNKAARAARKANR